MITLHEEMIKILEELANNTATANNIAELVNKRGNYVKKDESLVAANQIRARARKYPELFEYSHNRVTLKKNVNQIYSAEEIKSYLLKNTVPLRNSIEDLTTPSIYALIYHGKSFIHKELNEYVKIRPIIFIGVNSEKENVHNELSIDDKKSVISKILKMKLDQNITSLNNELSVTKSEIMDWVFSNLEYSQFSAITDYDILLKLKKELIELVKPILNDEIPANHFFYEEVNRYSFGITNDELNNIDTLKEVGFEGFVKIKDLRRNYDLLPNEKGIYFILKLTKEQPEFINPGTGGFFKGRDPNVSINTLTNKWVDDTIILYIGKAGGVNSMSNIKKRVKQLLEFGNNRPVGHWGGRYLWQLKDIENCVVCWKKIINEEPLETERKFINKFIEKYGRLPFANIT